MTMREWLIANGAVDRTTAAWKVEIQVPDFWLDTEIEPQIAGTAGTAALQISAGGDAIMIFNRTDGIRGSFALTRDDQAGRVWDHKSRGGFSARPFAKLILVALG